MQIDGSLLQRYNVPVPRYTSYPTVPYWDDQINDTDWLQNFQSQFARHNSSGGISLYIHLPFCETLCTYCGCNKKITGNHAVEEEYIRLILKEWDIYREQMEAFPVIRELHLGGGTPTFFSPENLQKLLEGIFNNAHIHPQHEFSIEGHPNNTTQRHLQVLYDLGFRRISYGVQDNDPDVQRIINRIQPVENVKKATDMARAIGFTSVNFDLIYGLPLQTPERMEKTVIQSIALMPDRIAFYSYAHVPWTSRGQRLFDEHDLPDAATKMAMYQLAKSLFETNGYFNIGMDHFALPSDDLYLAYNNGKLHRNFMGYTTQQTNMLIGLGVSSISDIGVAFAQNDKALHDYSAAIHAGKLSVKKGCFLSEEDISFKQYILDISCRQCTSFREGDIPLLTRYSFPVLEQMQEDGLLSFDLKGVALTDAGAHFIRNACSAFDLKLQKQQIKKEHPLFSKAV